jgi:hypothetical protein
MPKLLQHPRCKDFYFSPLSHGPLTLAYVTISSKYNNKLSLHVKKTLKDIRKCSFYKAIDLITYISNIFERNYLLQILYSAVTYTENNHSSNLLKLWIDDIYIKKIPKFNNFIQSSNSNLNSNYYIIIILGFEYKELPTQKEPVW